MKPHQQRVIEEKTELDIKLEALQKFVAGSPIFTELDFSEKVRLIRQELCMTEYSKILGERISAFSDDKEDSVIS